MEDAQDPERLDRLEINPEDVCRLISLARRFHVQEPVSLPEDGSNASDDDGAIDVLADTAEDPVDEEIRALVEGLDRSRQYELVALMWLGRGDASLDEYPDLVRQASEDLPADDLTDYLLEHPLLAGYLTDGLALHGYGCDE